jgi:lambda repressor-like predicted transcriptional regulator
MASAFERAIPRIERLVAEALEPILASIHRDGRITLVSDSDPS